MAIRTKIFNLLKGFLYVVGFIASIFIANFLFSEYGAFLDWYFSIASEIRNFLGSFDAPLYSVVAVGFIASLCWIWSNFLMIVQFLGELLPLKTQKMFKIFFALALLLLLLPLSLTALGLFFSILPGGPLGDF